MSDVIKLTNGVLIDQASIEGHTGIDMDNVLATNPSAPYTATQDCYIQGFVNGGAHIYLRNSNSTNRNVLACNTALWATFPVKKGQVVAKEGDSSLSVVYGLKK